MDWQVSDFNNSWRVILQGLVRRNPGFSGPRCHREVRVAILEHGGSHRWRARAHGCIHRRLAITAADICIGLSIHRWRSIPWKWPTYANVDRYYDRLFARRGFQRYGRDGGP
ncbi:MAG: hypothetical protein WDO56_07955 [Gammaproteobacteria bacterium]